MTFLQSSYDESKNENQDKEEDGNQSVLKQHGLFDQSANAGDSAKPTLVARTIIAATQLQYARTHSSTRVRATQRWQRLAIGLTSIWRKLRWKCSGVKADEFQKFLHKEETIDGLLKLQRTLNVKHLETRRAFVVNGRLLDPVALKTEFDASDLHVVAEADLEKRSSATDSC